MKLAINKKRFLEDFNRLSRIGETGGEGVTRLALSKTDIQIRKAFIKELEGVGAHVRTDDAGNIYGILKCGQGKDQSIAVGSHLDTVPNGGRFDGFFGVMSGLELLKCVSESEMKFKRNLMLVDFTGEEGSRFLPPLLGSGVATGVFKKEFANSRKDEDGKTFGSALIESGFLGEERNRMMYNKPLAYIEPHIEQGPALERENFEIGVPLGIPSKVVLEFVFSGETNQAGPTPMKYRRDALVGAAMFITFMRSFARKHGEKLVLTSGRIVSKPNIYNAIPGHAEVSLDVRTNSDVLMDKTIEKALDVAERIGSKENLSVSHTTLNRTHRISFDKSMVEEVKNVCEHLQLRYKTMLSGAGHDALYVNAITKSGMFFIPSVRGRSHTKEEFSTDAALLRGLNVLFRFATERLGLF